MELLADKELLDDVRKLINKNNETQELQSGGYVFSLIPSMTEAFAKVTEAIGKFFVAAYPVLFKFNLFKLGKRPQKDENGKIQKDDAGKIIYEDVALFRPHLKNGEGNFWRYLKFCAKISMYLCIFALGGILVTVFGLIYLYTKLAKHFNKLGKRGDTSDEPPKKD